MDVSFLPSLNAGLNATSAVFILAGYVFIRTGRREAHKRCMLVAVTTSTLFLISYVTYHYSAGATPFLGQGWIRPVYFSILGTHTLLAIAVLPLVIITLVRALRERYTLHKQIARWTFPVWLYVSVTGVVIYWLLYHAYAA
jgi:putative membrane protein